MREESSTGEEPSSRCVQSTMDRDSFDSSTMRRELFPRPNSKKVSMTGSHISWLNLRQSIGPGKSVRRDTNAYSSVRDAFATPIVNDGSGCDLSPEFLEAIELDRQRGELTKQVEEANLFKVLNHWTGTILNEVIYDAVFWLTLLVSYKLVISYVARLCVIILLLMIES